MSKKQRPSFVGSVEISNMVIGFPVVHFWKQVVSGCLNLETLKEVCECLGLHLIAWQNLAHECSVNNLKLFRLRPKHHQLDHLREQISRTRLNGRKVMSCFSDESFLGYLKRIGVRCHAASMAGRLFQRYVLFLSLRWRDAR